MQETIRFNILLPLNLGSKLKHLKEISQYNDNYYLLREYGDWISFGDENNNVLHEICDEDYESYSYEFGRIVNGKFVPVLGYHADGDILRGISIET